MSEWLELLDPDALGELLTPKAKPTKAKKPKTPRIPGETHEFKERKAAPPIREPRRVGPDLACGADPSWRLDLCRKYHYRPADMLGIYPLWPCHRNIDWS